MFPTHMSMIHEAMAGANWAKNVIKPKTYGLICLTSPEMQLACNEVAKIMDASGAKMVKKADVSISETSMSSQVLAMRAANPEHIIHYVINPATICKFLVEAAQQQYYPAKGISGNHMGSEIVGSLYGDWPAGRYWTNTTYRFWGTELMSTMMKYARANKGQVHHIVQAGYMAINMFAQAGKEVGPNLTRERMMATLGNGTVWKSDASLDQKFSYANTERQGSQLEPRHRPGTRVHVQVRELEHPVQPGRHAERLAARLRPVRHPHARLSRAKSECEERVLALPRRWKCVDRREHPLIQRQCCGPGGA